MQRRQQILIAGLLLVVVAWSSSGLIDSILFEPFQTRSENLAKLKKSVKDKGDEQLALLRAQRTLKEFKAISLPPDAGKAKQPTALTAQRIYTEWLTDVAQLCGLESLKVSPVGTTNRGTVYISVMEKIEAEARYEQLVMFLDLFYRTELLHRVTAMHIINKVFEGDPALKISLDIEGIVLTDAPSRKSLFPRSKLTEKTGDDATTIRISETEGFPKQAGFKVLIKNELLKVTKTEGEVWTVERAAERTKADSYAAGTSIELLPLDPKQADRSLDEFRQLVAANIFVKPAPPYKLKLSPLTEKTFTRGRSNDFTISVLGYDTQKGKPEFSLVDAPAGLKLEKSGKVSWKPDDQVTPGKYPVKFQVRHPSAPDGTLTETVTIRVKEAGRPPRLVAEKGGKVYLNRQWSFTPELSPSESGTPKYSWKLGDTAPLGMTINEKTGAVKWTPGDETEVGETIVPLVVTDSDSPPQTTTLNLKLDVEDDAAQFTRLTGIFSLGTNKRVFLTDQSTAKKTELHEGDPFAIADLAGKIKSIGGKSVMIDLGSREAKWDIGQSLREVQESIKEPASQSLN